MGPGFVRRDVPRSPWCSAATMRSFNGARLRSPGCAREPLGQPAELLDASMGPGFVRRDVRHSVRAVEREGDASMGPGFVRRDVRDDDEPDDPDYDCFNGARLRSPGCAQHAFLLLLGVFMLQWGPASFAGMCDPGGDPRL